LHPTHVTAVLSERVGRHHRLGSKCRRGLSSALWSIGISIYKLRALHLVVFYQQMLPHALLISLAQHCLGGEAFSAVIRPIMSPGRGPLLGATIPALSPHWRARQNVCTPPAGSLCRPLQAPLLSHRLAAHV